MRLDQVILRGTRGTQPGPGAVPAGTLYFVTDENITERNTGTAWQAYSAPATPQAHKASHQAGGSDALALDTLAAPTDVTTLNADATKHGLLPKLSGDVATFLRGDGAFAAPPATAPAPHKASHQAGGSDAVALDTLAPPTDVTTLNADTTKHGLLPKLPGGSTTFLRGDGTFAAPAAGAPAAHHATHEPGGSDVLNVSGPNLLLGHGNAGAGVVPIQEIALGPNLYMEGTTLRAKVSSSQMFNYDWSVTQTPPPTSSQIRVNAPHPYSAATQLYVRPVTSDGIDVYWGLMRVKPGTSMFVQDKNDHTAYLEVKTVGAAVDSGTHITFTVTYLASGATALLNNQGVVLIVGSQPDPVRTGALGLVLDGGGAVLTTGIKGFLEVPFACTLTGVTLLSTDPAVLSGSLVVDIWKAAYASYPPTVANTITASAKPTLSAATKSKDTTLTGWTTAIAAGDVLGFNVNSVTTLQRVALSLTDHGALMALPTTGLTAHFDASDLSTLFKTFVSGGPHTGTPVDGDTVAVWVNTAAANSIAKQVGASALPVYRASTPLLPRPCLDFQGSAVQRMGTTTHTGTTVPMSTVITATAYTLLIAFWAESVTNTSASYVAEGLVADAAGYWGAFLYRLSGVPNVLAYNYDGTQDYATLPATVAAPHVVMLRHESGVLYLSVDGGPETSAASGNTSDLTNQVSLGKGNGASFDGRLGEIAIYNTALTGTVLTDALTYFLTRWMTPAAAPERATSYVWAPL